MNPFGFSASVVYSPHTRDEPKLLLNADNPVPRTRGMNRDRAADNQRRGMFPHMRDEPPIVITCMIDVPRTRGDEPLNDTFLELQE